MSGANATSPTQSHAHEPPEGDWLVSFGPRKLSEDQNDPDTHGKQPGLTRDQCIVYCVKLARDPLGITLDAGPEVEIIPSDFDYLSVEEVKGGITNRLYKVENTKNGAAVLVRIYGQNTSYIIDRDREYAICKILADNNISKRIYVLIENGRIEEWLEGFTLTQEDMYRSVYMNGIAINMKRLHSVSLSDELRSCLLMGENLKSMLWPTIWKYFDLCTSKQDKVKTLLGDLDLEALKLRIQEIEKLCLDTASPLVLCHCDLLNGNILVTPERKVRFLDFEYSCIMERAFDIANHFNEYPGFSCDWSKLPSKDTERAFAITYLSYNPPKGRVRGLDESRYIEVSSENVDDLIKEIQPFYLASHAYWGVWSIVQSLISDLDFDFASYALRRLGMIFQQ